MRGLVIAMSILFSTSQGLRARTTDKMARLYTDAGTKATLDLAIFEPILLPGEYIIGHSAQRNHDELPDHEVIVVTPEYSDEVAFPVDYLQIWNDRGSKGYQDVAFWRPRCPSNYASLGDIITLDYEPPTGALAQRYVCIKRDLIQQGIIGTLIWDDTNSGAYLDGAVYTVASTDGSPTGYFRTNNEHSPPSSVDAHFIKLAYLNDAEL